MTRSTGVAGEEEEAEEEGGEGDKLPAVIAAADDPGVVAEGVQEEAGGAGEDNGR